MKQKKGSWSPLPLIRICEDITRKQTALGYLKDVYRATNIRPLMKSRKCSEIDAITFYETKLKILSSEYHENTRQTAEKTGVAFVTVPSNGINSDIIERVRNDFRFSSKLLLYIKLTYYILIEINENSIKIYAAYQAKKYQFIPWNQVVGC